MKRRTFLQLLSAASLVPSFAWAKTPETLRAENVNANILPTGETTKLWGYSGSTPGRVLRVKQGERLNVRLENDLEVPTAIHWHGIRIDNAMDGVPGLTQDAVIPGESFTYDFVAPDAGTYWYHSHNRSLEQVEKGLYGALIVEESDPPKVDFDIIVLLDDWRLNQDGTLVEGFDNMMDMSHGGRLGNFAKVMVIGANAGVPKGARIRLRLINTATDRIFPLEITGIEGEIVAYDGMPLNVNQPLDILNISPAQRVDIIADVTADTLGFLFKTQDGDFELGKIVTDGEKERSKDPFPQLPKNEIQSADLKSARKAEVLMQGGMMAAPTTTGTVWALSDRSNLDDAPIIKAKKGDTVSFDLVNETTFPHAIHFHGHHLQSVETLGLGPSRDTFLVEAGETLTVTGVLDNPGKWLIHCHMLAHNAGGMISYFEVEA